MVPACVGITKLSWSDGHSLVSRSEVSQGFELQVVRISAAMDHLNVWGQCVLTLGVETVHIEDD